ncbi:MAG: phosphoribosylglycinamide formyltransferase [Thiothrix sp.]|nr:MAG: phosphoribosylglycinamide formyltransferase [Thiothrix sp.]
MSCQIVVLLSGRGSNLKALINAIDKGFIPGNICAVISSNTQAKGLQLAKDARIPCYALLPDNYDSRDKYDQALSEIIDQYAPDLIVLAGFMRILGKKFVLRYFGQMLNIHPSRLPKHRGLHTHQKVLQAGDPKHGASVHFVTPELDGGPVILQSSLPVLPKHTPKTLAADILEQEHILYPRVIRWFCEHRLRLGNAQVFFDDVPIATPMQLNELSRDN